MRVQLDRCYIYRGKFYGPGEDDVPAGLAENLGVLEEIPGDQRLITIVPDLDALAKAAKAKVEQGGGKIFADFPTPGDPVLVPADGEVYDVFIQSIANPDRTYPTNAPLPAQTPHLGLLQAGGVTTVQEALAHPDLTQLAGIGKARAREILDYLEE